MVYFVSIFWGLVSLILAKLTLHSYAPCIFIRLNYPGLHKKTDLKEDGFFQQKKTEYISQSIFIKNKFLLSSLLITAFVFGLLSGICTELYGYTVLGTVKRFLIFEVLLIALITDVEFSIIPNMCPFLLMVFGVVFNILNFVLGNPESFKILINGFCTTIICFLFLIIVNKISHSGIGAGDIKLLSCLGFLCGIRVTLFTLFFSFLFCAVFSIVLLIAKKKKMKDSLQLAPFIFFGFIATIFLAIV